MRGMAAPKDLEEFRKQWKEELSNRQETSSTTEPKSAGDSGSSSVDKNDVQNEQVTVHAVSVDKSNLKTQKTWSGIEEAKACPNILPSFLLAEDLLKNHGVSLDQEEHKVEDLRRKSSDLVTHVTGQPAKKFKTEKCEEKTHNKKRDSFLDLFIADLNEINEIPFFDIELPRELAMKIFQHLDVTDLCRCAQVSKAWQSLAEDEYLWCNMCHRFGYEESSLTVDKFNWKNLMKSNISREHQVKANWKSLTGGYHQLHHARGGVLCAAHSFDQKIVAGYTNGEVKFWDLEQEEECIFKPSNTALVLDEVSEQGTLGNIVKSVAVNQQFTVAGYSQGNIDIWSNKKGTNPIHSFRGPGTVTDLKLCVEDGFTLAVAYGHHIRVESLSADGFIRLDSYDVDKASHLLLVHAPQASSDSNYLVAYSVGDVLNIHVPGQEHELITTLHHVIGQGVTCLDYRADLIAYGLTSYDWPLINAFKVKVQCLDSNRELTCLEGHPGKVECLNMKDSPPNMAVTGCIDGRVRVFDLRIPQPALTLTGLSSLVCCAQMDDWKVVAGSQAGTVTVWDQRMSPTKLWELHNRHPIHFLHFKQEFMVTANVPYNKCPNMDEDNIPAGRFRGNVQVYNFSEDQTRKDIPSICLSTYDEPEAYNYNVRLAMPYDNV